MNTLLVMVLLAATTQDKDVPIRIPLKGLTATCCEGPVQEELEKIVGIKSVAVEKMATGYVASTVMNTGVALKLTEVKKALGVATAGMGKAMGTTYDVAESLSASLVWEYRTTSTIEEGKLKESLVKWNGVVTTTKTGFRATFEKNPPTVVDVKNAVGIEITEILLAASKDGVRYSCPHHPEVANPVGGKCPLCNAELTKVAAGTTSAAPAAPPASPAKPGKKKG